MNRRNVLPFVFVIFVGSLQTTARAATWYLQADGSGAAPTIQDAINLAATGDTLLLAAGTYTGAGNVGVDFNGMAVVVISESGPGVTIVDCQGAKRGFRFKNGEGPGSVLSGLTITNGNTGGKGGGIECNGASPRILGNLIMGNHANKEGGGVYIKNGSPTLEINTIVENGTNKNGGGIFFNGAATPFLSYNIIAFNTQGGGVACKNATPNPIFQCNDLFGNVGGDALCGIDLGGNLSVDPGFCGIPGSGNFYLQSSSPCLPAASPCGRLLGAFGSQCGTTATRHETWGSIKSFYGDPPIRTPGGP